MTTVDGSWQRHGSTPRRIFRRGKETGTGQNRGQGRIAASRRVDVAGGFRPATAQQSDARFVAVDSRARPFRSTVASSPPHRFARSRGPPRCAAIPAAPRDSRTTSPSAGLSTSARRRAPFLSSARTPRNSKTRPTRLVRRGPAEQPTTTAAARGSSRSAPIHPAPTDQPDAPTSRVPSHAEPIRGPPGTRGQPKAGCRSLPGVAMRPVARELLPRSSVSIRSRSEIAADFRSSKATAATSTRFSEDHALNR